MSAYFADEIDEDFPDEVLAFVVKRKPFKYTIHFRNNLKLKTNFRPNIIKRFFL